MFWKPGAELPEERRRLDHSAPSCLPQVEGASVVGVVGWERGRDADSVGFACESDDTFLFFFNLWFEFYFTYI